MKIINKRKADIWISTIIYILIVVAVVVIVLQAGSIKGWRILSKTLLSEDEIDKIINYLGDGNLKTLLESDETFFIGFFLEIEPARNLKEQLEKMKGIF